MANPRDLPRGRTRGPWKRAFLGAVRKASGAFEGLSEKQLADTIRTYRRERGKSGAEHLEVPFETTVFDVPMIVRRVDITQANEIVRSATAVAIGRRFRFGRCRCRSVDQRAGSGSRPIDGGRKDGSGNDAADPRR